MTTAGASGGARRRGFAEPSSVATNMSFAVALGDGVLSGDNASPPHAFSLAVDAQSGFYRNLQDGYNELVLEAEDGLGDTTRYGTNLFVDTLTVTPDAFPLVFEDTFGSYFFPWSVWEGETHVFVRDSGGNLIVDVNLDGTPYNYLQLKREGATLVVLAYSPVTGTSTELGSKASYLPWSGGGGSGTDDAGTGSGTGTDAGTGSGTDAGTGTGTGTGTQNDSSALLWLLLLLLLLPLLLLIIVVAGRAARAARSTRTDAADAAAPAQPRPQSAGLFGPPRTPRVTAAAQSPVGRPPQTAALANMGSSAETAAFARGAAQPPSAAALSFAGGPAAAGSSTTAAGGPSQRALSGAPAASTTQARVAGTAQAPPQPPQATGGLSLLARVPPTFAQLQQRMQRARTPSAPPVQRRYASRGSRR